MNARTLPDHASDPDPRGLPIDQVGVRDLSWPIQVTDRQAGLQHTVARVSLSVGLPAEQRGTHMSRLIEVLEARQGEMTLRNLRDILGEVQRRLEADEAFLVLDFPYFLARHAPVSGARSLLEVRCAFEAALRGSELDFVLRVRVPVTSLCPCSKAISAYGAHNQRSVVEVAVRSEDFLWIEDVVEAVEASASAPLFALLKREDEKHLTELAYDNPRFAEDLVREVTRAVRALPGVRWLRVSADNHESIHNHDAFAELTWSDDMRATAPARFPPAAAAEAPPFGAWLRGQRAVRSLSQQELARHLGVSAAHLSRVESGEKGLSAEALKRLALLLDLDPRTVMVRGGCLPQDVLQAIARDPDGLLAWADARG